MGDVLFWPALALIACVAAVVFISVVRLRKLRHTIEHHMPEAVVRRDGWGCRAIALPGCVLSSCYRPVWREFSFRKSGRF